MAEEKFDPKKIMIAAGLSMGNSDAERAARAMFGLTQFRAILAKARRLAGEIITDKPTDEVAGNTV